MKFILKDKLLVLQFEKQLAWIVCVKYINLVSQIL